MSESFADVQLGCEVRATLADGTKTTFSAKELVIRLGDGTELQFDLLQYRIGEVDVYSDTSLWATMRAGNIVGICGRKRPDEADGVHLNDGRFTDSAVVLLENISPLSLANGGHVYDADWVPGMVLWALLCGPKKVGRCAIEQLGVDLRSLGERVTELVFPRFADGRPAADENAARFSLMKALEPLLNLADDESRELRHKWVGTEHLLLAAVKLADPELTALLQAHSVSYDSIRDQVLKIMNG